MNNNNRRVSPDNYIVEAISLDPDPTDKVLTWMTLQTPAGTLQTALTREAVEQLWGMRTLELGWGGRSGAASPQLARKTRTGLSMFFKLRSPSSSNRSDCLPRA